MRIGMVDTIGHNVPNLPLMKLSAWHKSRGDTVEFANPVADFEHEGKPSREQWRLAYWCNRKPLFYSVDYEEYRKNRT